ncbi:MAG TPA: acyltransferase family protein, partial [Acidimicrobiia bacterium]
AIAGGWLTAERPRAARAFRGDIEGLRAVAVAMVVLTHAGVGAFPGGYAGVDVFFVISGYLITSLIVDELQRSRAVSFATFYARRAKRILPAASAVIAVTVIAAYLWLGVLRGRQTAIDGVWAALFTANFHAIRQGTDYFAQGAAPSPLQHFWSLGVEEQFYVVWPSLLAVAFACGRRLRRPATALRVAVLAVLAVSLWWSIVQTASHPTTAYFSPFTRAWELAAGATIALFPTAIQRCGPALRAAATWCGLAAIVTTACWFTASTPFPGYTALLPVGGAALIIAGGAGDPQRSAGVVLGLRPVRWLGRISYSLYLWHWPVLVLAQEASNRPLSPVARAICVVVAIGLSQITYVLIESPLRSWTWLAGNPRAVALAPTERAATWLSARRALTVGAMCVVVALVASLAVVRNANVAIDAAVNVRAVPSKLLGTDTPFTPPTGDPTTAAGQPAGTTTTTAPPDAATADQRFRDTQAKVESVVLAASASSSVPRVLDPPVLQIASQGRPWYYWRCMEGVKGSVQCVYGDPSSTKTVFLVGDSHAGEWLPAVDQLAQQRGLRLVTLAKASCPPVEDVTITYQDGGPFPACQSWNAEVRQRIAAAHPYAVILAFSRYPGVVYRGALDSWEKGITDEVRDLSKSGARVVEIGGNGAPAQPPADCLSRNRDPRPCNFGPAGFAAQRQQDAAAVAAGGGSYIDVEPWFCAGATCPVIVDNRAVYFDVNHITAQYATDLAPMLGDAFDAALAH